MHEIERIDYDLERLRKYLGLGPGDPVGDYVSGKGLGIGGARLTGGGERGSIRDSSKPAAEDDPNRPSLGAQKRKAAGTPDLNPRDPEQSGEVPGWPKGTESWGEEAPRSPETSGIKFDKPDPLKGSAEWHEGGDPNREITMPPDRDPQWIVNIPMGGHKRSIDGTSSVEGSISHPHHTMGMQKYFKVTTHPQLKTVLTEGLQDIAHRPGYARHFAEHFLEGTNPNGYAVHHYDPDTGETRQWL